MRKFIIVGIVLAYVAFIILVIMLVLAIVSGCAESDAVKYARMKYPYCDVRVVERHRNDTTVEVRCRYKGAFRKTYRDRK